MRTKYVVPMLALTVAMLVLPQAIQARTAEEIQAEVQALLAEIAALQQQLAGLTSSPPTPTPAYAPTPPAYAPTSYASCPQLYRTLSAGMSGPDVSALQAFLAEDPTVYPEAIVSGYYGTLTVRAVERYQLKHGITSAGAPDVTGYGVVGPRTGAAIVRGCSVTPTYTYTPPVVSSTPTSCPLAPKPTTSCSTGWQAITDNYGCTTSYKCAVPLEQLSCPLVERPSCTSGTLVSNGFDSKGCALGYRCVAPSVANLLSASPTSGNAPLSVSFTARVSGGQGTMRIEFGDGQSGTMSLSAAAVYPPEWKATHTYSSPGTYTAQLLEVIDGCADWKSSYACTLPVSIGNLDTVTVTVGAATVPVQALQVTPASGSAPLTVTVLTSYGNNSSYRPSYSDGRDVLLDFGDGSSPEWLQCPGAGGGSFLGTTCSSPLSRSHTYTSAGTYSVRVYLSGGYCVAPGCPDTALATATVTVQGGTTATPSITLSSPTAGQTFSYGNAIPVSWQASNVPSGAGMYIQLVGSDGRVVKSQTVTYSAGSASIDTTGTCNGNFSDALAPCEFMFTNSKTSSYYVQAAIYTPANACFGFCAPGSASATILATARSAQFSISSISTSPNPVTCTLVAYTLPACPAGQHAVSTVNVSGCPQAPVCVADNPTAYRPSCPAALFQRPLCPANSHVEMSVNSDGCDAGPVCVPGQTTLSSDEPNSNLANAFSALRSALTTLSDLFK